MDKLGPRMKKAFALAEILIVVAIIGILAAIVLPEFQDHVQQAKEAAAKDNLRILRNAIELYAHQHNGVPPGYDGNDPSTTPLYIFFVSQLVLAGDYLPKLPENPFNGEILVKMIGNAEDFPTEPVEPYNGWVYQPATKTIKLNWEGTDTAGVAYFDY